MTDEIVSLGLPKGDVLKPLAELLESVEFPLSGYQADNRTYRPTVHGLPVRAKIMAEKDIALQVAVGNYDAGFCGRAWIEEHTIKYRATNLHIFRRLHLSAKNIYACSGKNSGLKTIEDLQKKYGYVTLVSEYPNLAKQFAIDHQLRKFKVFLAWGSVEAYPPEHADVVILAATDEDEIKALELRVLNLEFQSTLCLVINKDNLKRGKMKKFAQVFQYFSRMERKA